VEDEEGPQRGRGTAADPGLPNRLLVYLLFAVSMISLWVFRPVLANGFVNWDDQIYLAELIRMGKFSWASLRWMWTSVQPFFPQLVSANGHPDDRLG